MRLEAASMGDVTVRVATSADSEFAYKVKRASFKSYVEMVWGWDEAKQRQLHKKRFASQEYRVIQASGIDVGVLATVRACDCVKVNQLFILPEYQGQGIGKACMLEVIQHGNAAGLPVRLQVLKVNPRAVAFYERLGFRQSGQSETHILMERPPDVAVRLMPASLTPPLQLAEMLTELGDGENGFSGTPLGRGEMKLEEYLLSCCDGPDPAKLKPGRVPQTTYWLLDEGGMVAGMVRVRHCLNEWLLQHGGHIGFYIRPAYRGRGYGKLALRLALEELRKLGVKRALLTVNEDNVPSIRVIRSCGGILENVISDEQGKPRTMRFWIEEERSDDQNGREL